MCTLSAWDSPRGRGCRPGLEDIGVEVAGHESDVLAQGRLHVLRRISSQLDRTGDCTRVQSPQKLTPQGRISQFRNVIQKCLRDLRRRATVTLPQSDRPPATFRTWPMISRVQSEKHVLVGAPPFFMGSE
jgi:hypothetical protein